jgi:hypothetical protein
MTDNTKKRPPICAQCKWFGQYPWTASRCLHPDNEYNVVSGLHVAAEEARSCEGHCGPEGKNYEPQPPRSPRPPRPLPPSLQASIVARVKPWWLPSFLWRGK